MPHITGPSNAGGRSNASGAPNRNGRPNPDEPALVPSPTPDTPSLDDLTVPELEHDADTPCPGRLPATFGTYEILEEIASGGMGVVYRARDLELGREVALKMIRGDRTDWTGDLVRRFLLEARSAARLRHPNIVTVYQAGTHDNKHFFAMEYLTGGSLAQERARYQRDPAAAVALVEKVARAVHFAHTRGILHRDLKPANILLDAAGEPYVGDFGLAKPLDSSLDMTAPGEVLPGTPAYMAPEQAAGRASQVGPATDVWALGVILYELMTGKRPFNGENRVEVSDRICNFDLPSPRSVNRQLDPSLDAVILRCLEKDPERRCESAEALADELGRWRRGEPTLTRPERLPRRIFRSVRRHQTAATAIILTTFFLFVVAALFGTGLLNRPTPDPESPRAGDDAPDPYEADPSVADDRGFPGANSFDLLGRDGLPVHSRWQAGRSELNSKGKKSRTLFLKSDDRQLLEFRAPAPAVGYRFEAYVRVEATPGQQDALEEAGIYFAHSRVEAAKGDEHWFGKLSFGRDESVRRPFVQLVRFREERKPIMSDWRCANLQREIKFAPGSVNGWRHLAVEVRPDEIKAYCNDTLVGEIARQEMPSFASNLLQTRNGPRLAAPPDCFPAEGGIGLYNCRGSASFRNVKLTPFEP